MTEVRIHGRGGQGVVTAADLIAYAAFTDGHHAQAFPSFGSERTGAPVVSYCRIADKEIRTREPVQEPDLVVVQDATLLAIMDVFSGLKPDGFALVNSAKSAAELGIEEVIAAHPQGHVVMIPATEIAKKHLGRPLPNAVMLGSGRPDWSGEAIQRYPGDSKPFPRQSGRGERGRRSRRLRIGQFDESRGQVTC